MIERDEEQVLSDPWLKTGKVEKTVVQKVPNKNYSRIAGRSLLLAEYAAIGSLAAYGGSHLVISYFHNHIDGRYIPAKREKGLAGIDSYYNLKDTTEKLKAEQRNIVRSEYLLARRAFASFADYELKTQSSGDTNDYITQQRYNLAIDGANLLKNYYGFKDINVDQDKSQVEIPDIRKFDLKNPFDLIILDEVVNDAIVDFDDTLVQRDRKRAAFELKDIVWFANSGINAEVREGTFGYPKDKVLVNFARYFRTLDELGYQKPKKIVFRSYVGDGSEKSGFYVSGSQEIYLTDDAGEDSIVHEGAHFQASQNQEFSQRKFDDIVEGELTAARSSDNFDVRNTVVSDYAVTNSTEDYAETFMFYFSRGADFRFNLKKLQLVNNPAYGVLKAKYDFAKRFFGGREYLLDGEVFDPKDGDSYKISDPDGATGGIYLRPDPNLNKSANYPIVHNDFEVLLETGPEEFVDENGFVKKLWFVKYGVSNPDGSFADIKDKEGKAIEGWISGEWFGDIVVRSDNKVYNHGS